MVSGGLNARQIAAWKLQRVHVIEVAQRVAGHHHVHLRGTYQEGVKISAEELIGGVAGQPLANGQKFIGVLFAGLDAFLFLELLVEVVQGFDQEAARAAR